MMGWGDITKAMEIPDEIVGVEFGFGYKVCYDAHWTITHFEIFFQSALISAILTHFEKKIDNQILHGSFYFPFFKDNY